MPNFNPPIVNHKRALIQFIISDLPSIFLSLALFLGGIWLLSLRIPGWSLFFGLIITPLGIVFTIYTLDDIARNVVAPPPFKPVRCNVCGKITYAKEDEKDVICWRCREDITEKILEEKAR
ncbi:hypothetical protein KKI19_00530 [Patescibacteria group bacterium]|nr:hypothetical protein [Patescibacteria group bacterium]